MLNPKLKEMYPYETVINALTNLSDFCEINAIRIGVYGYSCEVDAKHPEFIIQYDNKLPTAVFMNYLKKIYDTVNMSDEPTGPMLVNYTRVFDSVKEEVFDLWVK